MLMRDVVGVNADPSWADRDGEAARRDQRALARDLRARERDDEGRRRDLGARLRDRAAAERDRRAMQRDTRAMGRSDPPDCVADRIAATQERTAAALDRIRGADDRREAALDRHVSALDRWQSSVDRLRGAEDRRSARIEHARLSVDELTGLLRRGNGLGRLQSEIERGRRTGAMITVAFVDVDDLKRVNDTTGHDGGDALLRDVAKALRDCMRSYDVVMRFGGDEFVCGMVDVRAAVAAERFQKVARLLDARHASVSVGVAELADGETAHDLVVRADRQLVQNRQRRAVHVQGRAEARVRDDVGA
jgi:diguanylate cyclase (GGDEF)-like protein